jgi:hypothetical protein
MPNHNHKPYNPTSGEMRLRRNHPMGTRVPNHTRLKPDPIENELTTNLCVVCGRVFHRPETICNACGNCQACGGFSDDRYGNLCTQCGNDTVQPRYDTLGPTFFMTNTPPE